MTMHGQNHIKFVHSVVCGQHLMDAFQGLTDVRQEGDRGLIAPEPSVLFRWMERRWRICLSSYPFSLKVVFRNTNSTYTNCLSWKMKALRSFTDCLPGITA